MVRVKKALNAKKHRKNLLKQAKGFRNGRKNKERLANEAIINAGERSFAHRRDKKNVFRRLWITRINASLRNLGDISYSKWINNFKTSGTELDRKVLADLAKNDPEVFERLVSSVAQK